MEVHNEISNNVIIYVLKSTQLLEQKGKPKQINMLIRQICKYPTDNQEPFNP